MQENCETARPTLRIRICLGVLLLISVFSALLAHSISILRNPRGCTPVFPNLQDIKEIQVGLNADGAGTVQRAEFLVPKAFIAPIHDWFSGATIERDPAKWIVGSYLVVTTHAGQRFRVSSFHTGNSPPAFAVVCDSLRNEKLYYRTPKGSSLELYDILERARTTAEKEKAP